MCSECGKSLKNQEKFEQHCMGHGDPELECNKCHKVFASKFTLRTHRKLHFRKFACTHCRKTYSDAEDLRHHAAKIHYIFMCEHCDYVANKCTDLTIHQENNHQQFRESSENDFTESLMEEVLSESDILAPSPEATDFKLENVSMSLESHNGGNEEIRKADSIIAKVMSNKLFLLHSKKARRNRRYNKVSNILI